jgi:hypothetical protein
MRNANVNKDRSSLRANRSHIFQHPALTGIAEARETMEDLRISAGGELFLLLRINTAESACIQKLHCAFVSGIETVYCNFLFFFIAFDIVLG